MKLSVVLKQVNKAGNVSFKAVKAVNTGNAGLEVVAIESAKFCSDIIKLKNNVAKLGYASAVNGIKKSLPMQLDIVGLDDADDVNIQLSWNSFGKFANESTEAKIRKFFELNIEFAETHFDTELS